MSASYKISRILFSAFHLGAVKCHCWSLGRATSCQDGRGSPPQTQLHRATRAEHAGRVHSLAPWHAVRPTRVGHASTAVGRLVAGEPAEPASRPHTVGGVGTETGPPHPRCRAHPTRHQTLTPTPRLRAPAHACARQPMWLPVAWRGPVQRCIVANRASPRVGPHRRCMVVTGSGCSLSVNSVGRGLAAGSFRTPELSP